MSDYGDIFGRYTDATGIMREYLTDVDRGDDRDLAGWLEDASREIWGAEHDAAEDWYMLARSVERDALHGDWTLDDVAAGHALVVTCPECGQTEIWGLAELSDHGKCRNRDDACPACGR